MVIEIKNKDNRVIKKEYFKKIFQSTKNKVKIYLYII